jgi:hypothetical protein
MIGHFALDLEIVETLSLVQSVRVLRSSTVVTWKEITIIISVRSSLLVGAIITFFCLICRVSVRVVDKALLLEEVTPSCLPSLINLRVFLLEGVILNVNLPLVEVGLLVLDVLLNHCY